MFRFSFGLGSKDKDSSGKDARAFVSPPPPKLDLETLRREGAERSRRTQEALSRGQLPPNVVERIQSQKTGSLPWTSDLSVNEWLSLRQYKMMPLGQVMGSAFYQVGFIAGIGGMYYTASRELPEPTQALYSGRRLALSRMQQEAALMGANAVVGVHLEHKGFDFEKGVVEYVTYGTAVRFEGLQVPEKPILCTVSGQDFARLVTAGALPVGLGLGATFYYLRTDWWDMRQERSWYNQEMSHFQQGLSMARHHAVSRMREDLGRLGAVGVVGAEFQLRVEEVPGGRTSDDEEVIDHIIEVSVLGTAIDRIERGAPRELTARPVLDLRR